MKGFLRALSMLIVLCIFVVLLSVTALGTSAAEMRYGKTILSKLNNSAALQFVYNRLVEGCEDAEATISVQDSTHKISWDELVTVYNAFHNDYPEYFWITNGFSGKYNPNTGYVTSVSPVYYATGDKLKTQKASFASVSKELLSGLSGKSDYEKSLILHDRLAEHVTYASSSNDQTAYGALVEKKAICAGYARAYQYLMLEAGIPAWVVIGSSVNPATGNRAGHEWNLVSLNGKWYYTDVTWDDQGKNLYYAYLNVTTSVINEDHTVTDFKDYLPSATATDANYFYKNKLTYSSMDVDKVAKALTDGNGTARLYVTGNLKNFRSDLNSKMSSIVQKMNSSAGSNYSYSQASLGREIILTVNIIAATHTHKLKAVSKVAATCSSEGHKAYYTCSCGKWFSDFAGEAEITDKDSVVIKALSHKASGWKTDKTKHWKVCTACGTEISGSEGIHIDADNNGKCDTCSAKMVVAGSGASTIVGTDPNNNVSSPSESTDAEPEYTDELTSSDESVDSEIANEDGAVADGSSNGKGKNNKTDKDSKEDSEEKEESTSPIAVAAAATAGAGVAAAGTGGTVFFIRRKFF